MTISKTLFSSKKMDWETPQLFFEELNKKYKFDLDACSSDDNHKVDNYFTEHDNALTKLWEGNVFVNPPYGRELYSFVEKSYVEHIRDKNRFIVLLIPARTDTKYWHEFIQGKATIKFLRGRLKFEISGIASDAAPFPSVLIIYGI